MNKKFWHTVTLIVGESTITHDVEAYGPISAVSTVMRMTRLKKCDRAIVLDGNKMETFIGVTLVAWSGLQSHARCTE